MTRRLQHVGCLDDCGEAASNGKGNELLPSPSSDSIYFGRSVRWVNRRAKSDAEVLSLSRLRNAGLHKQLSNFVRDCCMAAPGVWKRFASVRRETRRGLRARSRGSWWNESAVDAM